MPPKHGAPETRCPRNTIVNVALPAIQRDIGGSLAGLQWVIDAYTLALAVIMLTAGSAAGRVLNAARQSGGALGVALPRS